MQISKACQGNMHGHCQFPETCACQVCHHVCGVCGEPCQAVYASKAEPGVLMCAKCCRLEIKAFSTLYGSQCPECGRYRPTYRDPRANDERHLCTPCHVNLGHRYQQPDGRWVTTLPGIDEELVVP